MRVLLVNDDGPPAPHSPHVLGLYEAMTRQPGWEVWVVLPSSQKSWGSMAFTLQPPCSAWYYYPLAGNHDGTHKDTAQSWSAERRPVRQGELGEWILIDGSPTTCANIGLHSLHSLLPDTAPSISTVANTSAERQSSRPPPFDLVVSGPNFGRNTGTAFSLCSGTIGAALAASLSDVRAIGISYAHFHQTNRHVEAAEKKRAKAAEQQQAQASEGGGGGGGGGSDGATQKWGNLPDSAPHDVVQRAHELSVRLIAKLYEEWEPGVGVYTVNVPLTFHLLDEGGPQVYWTRTWDSKFGPLFELEEQQQSQQLEEDQKSLSKSHLPQQAPPPSLAMRFAPNMTAMLQPLRDQQSTQTDIWAILHGHISVSRLNPSYTAVDVSAASSGKPGPAPGSHFKL